MKITKMFTERALFCPEFAASEQAQMNWYLSMLKTIIHHFVSNQRYSTLVELHETTRRRETEFELHKREPR